ncbi:MAG: 2-amino-4-hydroxy-6-hydroxymethyldihydropteridine diphosphokinase, partial [Cyanobacteriota bacterium]
MACESIAIALGANLGDPLATLIAVRPLLEQALQAWWCRPAGGPAPPELAPLCRWSPIFRTEPVGGPPGQPDYLNAALLCTLPGRTPLPLSAADPEAPLALLRCLQQLEGRFGRQRHEHWGPRTLDLDLLWCGERRQAGPELELPHPRLRERSFVLAPLAAIQADLVPPQQDSGCAALLEALLPRLGEAPPQRLPPRS